MSGSSLAPSPVLTEAAREAADRYATPLYLYDLARLDADARAMREAFPKPWLALYSLKANGLPALLERIRRHGVGASCVSWGELGLAMKAGFASAEVALEGVGKSDVELRGAARLAIDGTPLLWVSLESAEEAAALADHVRRARGRSRVRQDVLVRVNPAVAPETLHGLAVGAANSKFGVLASELPAVIEAGGGASGPLRGAGCTCT